MQAFAVYTYTIMGRFRLVICVCEMHHIQSGLRLRCGPHAIPADPQEWSMQKEGMSFKEEGGGERKVRDSRLGGTRRLGLLSH